MIKYFTELHLGSVVIRDPATSVTNLLIFLSAFRGYLKTRKAPEDYKRSWSRFFLFLGIGALIGIVTHSFSYYTPVHIHLWIWIVMGLFQAVGVSFAQIATARQYFPRQTGLIHILALFQLVCASGLFIYLQTYEAVKAHIALALVPIMGWSFYKGAVGNRNSGLIGLGILFATISALILAFKITLGPWFNYNDIAHLFVIASLLIMTNAVVNMQPEPVHP
jgi:hypothetical protein